MGDKKNPKDWKNLKFRLNMWFYENRLKEYARSRDMSIRATIQFIIHDFFKDKPIQ